MTLKLFAPFYHNATSCKRFKGNFHISRSCKLLKSMILTSKINTYVLERSLKIPPKFLISRNIYRVKNFCQELSKIKLDKHTFQQAVSVSTFGFYCFLISLMSKEDCN